MPKNIFGGTIPSLAYVLEEASAIRSAITPFDIDWTDTAEDCYKRMWTLAAEICSSVDDVQTEYNLLCACVNADIEDKVKMLWEQKGKIPAIKFWRALYPGLGLRDCKEAVENMCD